MNYQELIQKCDEYYDFTMTTYHLVKSTILGPEEDVPFIIEADDSPIPSLLGFYNGLSIHIYLFSILNHDEWDDNGIKNVIVYIVIHELHHVIQNVDTRLYETNAKYHREIEDSCDWMSWNYINKFKDELEEFLELSVDTAFMEEELVDPLVRTTYLRYKNIDANLWANFINSLVATTSDTGVYPELEDIINKSTNCMLQLERRNSGEITHTIGIKYNGNYFCIDDEARTALNYMSNPHGTLQCSYYKNDYIDIFVISYTMSDVENEETSHLYAPLIRLKEEQ